MVHVPTHVLACLRQESFNGAKSWVKELQRRAEPNVVIALAANKADLKERAVDKDVRTRSRPCPLIMETGGGDHDHASAPSYC